MLLTASPDHTNRAATGRAAVIPVPPRPSKDGVKAILDKHQPTVGELPEKDCAICGKNWPCPSYREAEAKLAQLNGARPPRFEEHEDALTALARSLPPEDQPDSSGTPSQRWLTIWRTAITALERIRSRQWEPFSNGYIRAATPSAHCQKCGKSCPIPQLAMFEIRYDGLVNQVVCFPHLVNPTSSSPVATPQGKQVK